MSHAYSARSVSIGSIRAARRVSEVGQHDANDLRRLRIDRELPSEGRLVAAEAPLPERVRENDRP
jgi:hypothetical protein